MYIFTNIYDISKNLNFLLACVIFPFLKFRFQERSLHKNACQIKRKNNMSFCLWNEEKKVCSTTRIKIFSYDSIRHSKTISRQRVNLSSSLSSSFLSFFPHFLFFLAMMMMFNNNKIKMKNKIKISKK